MKRLSIALLFIIPFLAGCEKAKPEIDVPLPSQGPDLKQMQPTEDPF